MSEIEISNKKESTSKGLLILFPILAVVINIAIMAGGSVLLTTTGYFYLIILASAFIWNIYYALKHLLYSKRAKAGKGTLKGLILVVFPALFSAVAAVMCFFPWFFPSMYLELWYLSTWFSTIAGIFILISCVWGLFIKPVRRISIIFLIYSCFALSITIPAAFVSIGLVFDNPITATLSLSNTMFQISTANGGAIFHPLFISPMFCIKFNNSESFSEFLNTEVISFSISPDRASKKTINVLKMIIRRVFLLWVLIAIAFQSFFGLMEGVSNINGNGMSTYHIGNPDLEYKKTSNLRTIAVAKGPSDKNGINGIRRSWSDVVDAEIQMAKDAGIGYLRWRFYDSFLKNDQCRFILKQSVDRVHAAGLKVVLLPRGKVDWEFGSEKATPEEYFQAHYYGSLDLSINFSADWVLPLLEANIQGPMQMQANASLSVADWKSWFSTIVNMVHDHPESHAKVVAAIAAGHNEIEFVEALAETNVDAIGFDIYPMRTDMVASIIDRLAPAFEGYTGERWLTEFGVETVAFGEQSQANLITLMMSEASLKWDANGFTVWSLQDLVGEMPSHLGLFRADGTAKPAVAAFKAAVTALQS